MIDEVQKQRANSEMNKYVESMEKERESFSFIEIDFLVDMRIAERAYKEEYKKDIGGVRTAQLSFNQWLECKKFEASKFYMKHSDFYLGF
jgi:hypothetical protein